MARPDKVTAVAEIADGFRDSNAAVLTEYRGLTVAQLKTLRRTLGSDTTYAVVKNTLTKRAVRESDIPSDAADKLDALLEGPTAIAFVGGDPVEAAKGLRDFAKANPLLVIKGGVLDGKALTADEIRKLADLESREVLLSKMAGALLASLSGAAALFQAPLAKAARLSEALRQKAEADPSILRGGAGTPAPTTVAEVAEAEEPAPAEDAAVTVEDTATDESGATDAAAVSESTDSTESTESTESTDSTDSTDSAADAEA